MDLLTAYGAIAVTVMMLAYALEGRSRAFVLLFACACVASSLYGWLQGAWPFGVVELVWSGVALRRWWRLRDGADRAVAAGGNSEGGDDAR
ncbi:MAG TPA: hypothetical protein VMU89_12375 [Thermomicrobiaceae bacterium]|nr:hypothetical protein [Thermomicrobiaceae bacterium]